MRQAFLIGLLTMVSVCSFALEGFGAFGPVTVDTVSPNLTLISPNGGEIWRAGTIHDILWTASDNHFGSALIDISYTADSGPTTLLFDSVANTGTHRWRLPWLQSDRVLAQIRAKDHFGNINYVQSAAYFAIYRTLPLAPVGLTISVESDTNILLTWQAVTHNVDGSPVIPDGYLVLCSEFAVNDPTDYIVLGNCSEASYTHQNAVLDWPNCFYTVMAYTTYSSGASSLLGRFPLDLAPKTIAPEPSESFQLDEEKGK